MDQSTTAGTIGGTVLAMITIPTTTILSTIALAVIGATVSFVTSLLLKYLYEHHKTKKNGSDNSPKN